MLNTDDDTIRKFPKEIAIGLIAINCFVCLMPFLKGVSLKILYSVMLSFGINFIMIPLIFILVGYIQKLRDASFSLWNMYFFSMLIGTFLTIQKVTVW